jgi:hypothetical protein
LVYLGGTIRTGRYEFRCNNAAWKALCKRIQDSPEEAAEVVRDVIAALMTPHATGTARSWLEGRLDAKSRLSPDVRALADSLLSLRCYVYRNRCDYSRELGNVENVIYGLWRLNENEQPIAPLPLNIGESKGTWLHNRSKDHCNWWGDKPIGITLVNVEYDTSERKYAERILQDTLIPLANTQFARLDLLKRLWHFKRP